MKQMFIPLLLFIWQTGLGAEFKEINIMAPPKASYIVVGDVNKLYHWTSQKSICRRLYDEASNKNRFPFDKKVSSGSDLGKSFPQLDGVAAFYVWKNSVGGTGAS